MQGKLIFLAGLVLATSLLTGCGREDEAEAPEVDDAVRGALFERVDADSIYIFANLEPLPESLSERFWQAAEPIWETNSETYDVLLEATESPLARALIGEFLAIDSREAFEARGFESNGLWAIHALSLYPVVHWQLTDPQAFEAMLDRASAEAGTDLPTRRIDSTEIIWVEIDNFGLAVHHDEHFITLALVPDDDALLRRVANLEQPGRAFPTSTLADFNRERGFKPQGSGYLDFNRLFDALLDGDDPHMAPVRDALDLETAGNDAACRNELRALADIIPRISTGYTGVTGNRIDLAMTIETDADLGNRLAAIADSPVALANGRPGLFSAGMAFNLVAARDFARDLVGGWVEHPPECPMFSNIRDQAEEWQLGLNRPIPPVITNLQGFRVEVDRLEIGEDDEVMGDAAGTLAVFMRNPQMLIGMAQMFSPQIAELELAPGKEPQRLPAEMLHNMPEGIEAWIAMGENAIGLALGADQRDRLPAALESGESGSAILHYAIHWPAYAEMMQAMMERTRAELEQTELEIDMPPNDDMFAGLAEAYRYSDATIELTGNGIRMSSSLELAD